MEEQNKEPSKTLSYYRKFKPGEMINSQAKQVILNVFFHLSGLNPEKAWTKIANETAGLTGVSSKTVFRLKNEKQQSMLQEKITIESAPQCDINPENPDYVSSCPGLVRGCIDNVSLNPTLNEDLTRKPAPPMRKKRKEKGNESPRSRKRKCTVKPKTRMERYDEYTLSAIRFKMQEFNLRNETPTVNKVMAEINADTNLPNFTRSTFHRILKDMGFTRFLKKPRGPKAGTLNANRNNLVSSTGFTDSRTGIQ